MTISLPQELLDKIDRLARADKRTRSNWVVIQLEKRLQILGFGEAGEKIAADAGGLSSGSTRDPAAAHGINEVPTAKPSSNKERKKS